VHSVRSIAVSIISLFNEPNCDSPANVDAGRLYRDNKVAYANEVRKCVRKSVAEDEKEEAEAAEGGSEESNSTHSITTIP